MPKKMKILQVVPYFPPAWGFGGPVRHVYERSKALVERGHHVTVCTTDAQIGSDGALDVPKNQPTDVDGIETYYFSNISNTLASRYNTHLPWNASRVLRKIIQEYDIVHMQGMYSVLHLIAHRLSTRHSIPYVLSPGNSYPPNRSIGRLRVKDIFLNLGGSQIVSDANRIIALTSDERKRILSTGVQPNLVVTEPFGMDLTDFAEGVHDGVVFRRQHGIAKDGLMILFVGRLHRGKGITDLINTFALLPDDLRRRCHLVLVGPNSNARDEINDVITRNELESKVIFTGLLSGEQKFQAYNAADVFVLPSHSEQLPRVALEASASGIPIIITRESNVPEVELTNSGYLYDSGNTSALLKFLVDSLTNHALRKIMGANGRQMISDYYSWLPVIKRLESTYQQCIDESVLDEYMAI